MTVLSLSKGYVVAVSLWAVKFCSLIVYVYAVLVHTLCIVLYYGNAYLVIQVSSSL